MFLRRSGDMALLRSRMDRWEQIWHEKPVQQVSIKNPKTPMEARPRISSFEVHMPLSTPVRLLPSTWIGHHQCIVQTLLVQDVLVNDWALRELFGAVENHQVGYSWGFSSCSFSPSMMIPGIPRNTALFTIFCDSSIENPSRYSEGWWRLWLTGSWMVMKMHSASIVETHQAEAVSALIL